MNTDFNDIAGAEGQLVALAERGDPEAVKDGVLRRRFDVNDQNDLGETALMWAVSHQQIELVRWLLDHGATVNMTDNRGETALMWAAGEGYEDIARLLLDRGAIPDVTALNNFTAQHYAVLGRHTPVVQLLKEREKRALEQREFAAMVDAHCAAATRRQEILHAHPPARIRPA